MQLYGLGNLKSSFSISEILTIDKLNIVDESYFSSIETNKVIITSHSIDVIFAGGLTQNISARKLFEFPEKALTKLRNSGFYNAIYYYFCHSAYGGTKQGYFDVHSSYNSIAVWGSANSSITILLHLPI